MTAHIINPDTGDFRELAPLRRALEMHCGFSWSPNGRRLACETFGVSDPNLNGVYSIRSSDGRGVQRITTNPGGDDIPGDYSPDGSRIVFARSDGNGPVGLLVARLDGTHLHPVTPPGLLSQGAFGGNWAPHGNKIVFTTRTDAGHRAAVWMVKADGTDLHKVPISRCGGAFTDLNAASCFQPAWSPNGKKLVFTRLTANGSQDIYTVRADGSHLSKVTHSGRANEPDWGIHPLIH
jgi:TolB protein